MEAGLVAAWIAPWSSGKFSAPSPHRTRGIGHSWGFLFPIFAIAAATLQIWTRAFRHRNYGLRDILLNHWGRGGGGLQWESSWRRERPQSFHTLNTVYIYPTSISIWNSHFSSSSSWFGWRCVFVVPLLSSTRCEMDTWNSPLFFYSNYF